MPQSSVAARFTGRLPNLITLFFSLTLVNAFRLFADFYHWPTAPTFDFGNPAQVSVAVSFIVTIFWVATAWLSWSMLVERFPYTLHLGRFFFDIFRFSVMFAIMNFLFLAAKPESFQWYIFSFAFFYLMMAVWYVLRLRSAPDKARRDEWAGDARGHALRTLTFLVLGVIYVVGVAAQPAASYAPALRWALVLLTFVAVVVWSVERLRDLVGRALAESPAA